MNVEEIQKKYMSDSLGAFGKVKNPIEKHNLRAIEKGLNSSFKTNAPAIPGNDNNYMQIALLVNKVKAPWQELKAHMKQVNDKYLQKAFSQAGNAMNTFIGLVNQKGKGGI